MFFQINTASEKSLHLHSDRPCAAGAVLYQNAALRTFGVLLLYLNEEGSVYVYKRDRNTETEDLGCCVKSITLTQH